jgi:hypothetical protein
MDIHQLIHNWHRKASSEEDYFSRFVFEYLAFIAFLKKVLFAGARSDRNAIQELKQHSSIRDQYLQTVNNDQELRQAWQNIKAELERNPLGNVSQNGEDVEEIRWWNCSSERIDEKSQQDNQRIKGVIHRLDDWGNMVEFLYSIRNNLFHGGKDPQDRRDQLLVENGYKTLSPLVELLLKTNK